MEDAERYARQIALPEIGSEGQEILARTHAAVVGCGALGTNIAEIIVRAGVGHVMLIDYDILELSNLQRQALVTENDVDHLKAEVLAERLTQVNSTVEIDYRVERVTAVNVEPLLTGMDIVFDGLDNYPARYIVNDACVKHRIPWVFSAVAGTYGETMPILPGDGPCLRCLIPTPPPDAAVLTAGTNGLLNTVPRAIAAIAATSGIKVMLNALAPPVSLITIDMWTARVSTLAVARDPACPCCGAGKFEFINQQGERRSD